MDKNETAKGMTLEITLRKAVMTLDGAIDGIEGYYNPQYRWNGAVVPLFTYENACKVAEHYKAVSGNSMYWSHIGRFRGNGSSDVGNHRVQA